MVDLSGLSLEELERAVADEKRRRRAMAISELEAVAAKHGFALADVIGRAAKPKSGGMSARAPYGTYGPHILPLLRAGLGPTEIRKRLGMKNNGAIYAYAKRHGITISKGRVVQ